MASSDPWETWSRDAIDRVPDIGESVRIWDPLRDREIIVDVIEHRCGGTSFVARLDDGRAFPLPPMTLVKDL